MKDDKIILWWNDDGVVIQCRRDDCLQSESGTVTRLFWWEVDVTGKTPAEADHIARQHIREAHQ